MSNAHEMSQRGRALLKEVRNHHLMKGSEVYGPILEYLVDHSFPNTDANREHRKASVLATRFFASKDNPDERVRNAVKTIKAKLAKYFDGDGRHHGERLAIEEGGRHGDGYLVTLIGNAPSTAGLDLFWQSHFNRATTIIYSEPLFFYNPDTRVWMRDLRINDRAAPNTDIPEGFSAAFNYIPTGEVRAMLELTKFLGERQTRVEHASFRYEDWDLFPKTDIVFLGAPRSNPLMRLVQTREPFYYFVGDDWIDHVKDRPKDVKRPYQNVWDKRSDTRLVHILVTRSRARDGKHWITTIAATHGRAIQRLSEVLSNEDEFQELMRSLPGTESPLPLPDEFQLIFSAEVFAFDTQATKLVWLDRWPRL